MFRDLSCKFMTALGNFGTSRMRHGGLPAGSSGLGCPDLDLAPVVYLGAVGGVLSFKRVARR